MVQAMLDTGHSGSAAGGALSIRDLNAWYGESHVLHGISLDVAPGEVVTLVGRNGAGKSTTLKSIVGIIREKTGSIRVNGVECIGRPPRATATLGLGYVPEERGIYATLSVRENLMLPRQISDDAMPLEAILDLFPNIRERMGASGTSLSGGEQQMLAIARILRTGARLVLLDEPTEGLAPVIVEQIERTLRSLAESGFTLLLVEQNLRFAASLAQRHYLLEEGLVVDCLDAADMRRNEQRLRARLGL